VCSASTAAPRTVPIDRPVQHAKLTAHEAQFQRQLRSSARSVGNFRTATFKCQDTLGVPRSRASASIWALPRSLGYRQWAAGVWKARAASCERTLAKRTIPATNDWLTAVRLVQRIYPGTEAWLRFISHREGGWGGFVMNHQGSGAGGWVQFMSSTYYAYSGAAFADAKRRGFIVDRSWNAWTHPLGQAITAGFMRFTGRDGCHWCL
jgi:hypothetical protein